MKTILDEIVAQKRIEILEKQKTQSIESFKNSEISYSLLNLQKFQF